MRVTLNCKVRANQIDSLIPFLQSNLPQVRAFDGCESVSVLFDRESSEMLLEEEWQSVNQHQSYLAHIENNGVLAELGAFLDAAPSIKYFTLAPI